MTQLPKTRVMREIPPEWDEMMQLAAQIKFGEIFIDIQDGRIIFVKYTVKRKPNDPDELTIFAV